MEKEYWEDLKPGDYVVALRDSKHGKDYYCKGDILKIYDVTVNKNNINYIRNSGKRGGDGENNFRKATQEELIAANLAQSEPKSKQRFEVGKWYRDERWSKGAYAKFLRLEFENHFYFSEGIRDGYFKREDWWLSYDNANVREVPIKEIQEYLPEGHPDKIQPTESINQLLERAKKEFPVGCKFYPIFDDGEVANTIYEQKKECYVYDSLGGLWIIGSANVYSPICNKWAKIVSMPETKTSIKRAVHCKTQEEWDFAAKRLGRKAITNWRDRGDCIKLDSPDESHFFSLSPQYQDISFEEWCEENGYILTKMADSPCKIEDYLYLIDATIDGYYPDYRKYSNTIIKVTGIRFELESKVEGKSYWIIHSGEFGGGGFRLGGRGWGWNKHIRLATPSEVTEYKQVRVYEEYINTPIVPEQKIYPYTVGESVKHPKLKLKSNKKLLKITYRKIKISNKHLN